MRRRCVNDGPVTARVSSPVFFSTPFIRVQCVDDGNKSFISLYCNGFLSSHPTPPSTHNQLPVPVTSPYPPPPLSLLSSISLTSPELRGDPGQTSCRGNRQNSFFFFNREKRRRTAGDVSDRDKEGGRRWVAGQRSASRNTLEVC